MLIMYLIIQMLCCGANMWMFDQNMRRGNLKLAYSNLAAIVVTGVLMSFTCSLIL